MANKSAAQRIKELDEERNSLLSTAKKEALDRVSAGIADLGALGFSYRLVTGGASANAQRPKGNREVKASTCPVCKFQTNPPHDARRHRSQGKRKKPLTPKELTEFGLTKV